MTSAIVKLASFVVLTGACSGSEAGTLKLGDTGWVVDAPAHWTVETHNDHWFTVHSPKLGHGFDVRLGKVYDNPALATDEARFKLLTQSLRCDDPAAAQTGRTPSAGYFAQCAGSQTPSGKTTPLTMNFLLDITADDLSTGCSVHGAPELDPDDVAACKSLRKPRGAASK